jgi:hypothetical protein
MPQHTPGHGLQRDVKKEARKEKRYKEFFTHVFKNRMRKSRKNPESPKRLFRDYSKFLFSCYWLP